jgi:hypothetical protein
MCKIHEKIHICLHDLFAANGKGMDGCVAVLEEDGTLVDDDDVVKELEKNTVVMIINSQDAWKSPTFKYQGEHESMPHENKHIEKDGNMRLEFKGGNLQLRKPTKLVSFKLLFLIFITALSVVPSHTCKVAR